MVAINDADIGFLQYQYASISKSSCLAAGSSTAFEDSRNVAYEQLLPDIERGLTKYLQFFPGVSHVTLT